MKPFIHIILLLISIAIMETSAQNLDQNLICKTWVFQIYDEEAKKQVFVPFLPENVDTSFTYTTYYFNGNGTVQTQTYYSKEDLSWRMMKPCGHGDPRIEKDTWSIKNNVLTRYTRVNYIATTSGYEQTVMYKIVQLSDDTLELKEIKSKYKKW